jgi:hypothetical protein
MHQEDYQIRCKINNMRIPAEHWFVGKSGVYLDFSVQPLREPDEKTGDTHSISIYDPQSNAKTYIGRGRLVPLERKIATPDQLPPRMTDDSGIEDAKIVNDENDQQ